MLKKTFAAVCAILCLMSVFMPFLVFANEVDPLPETEELPTDYTKYERLILNYTLNEDATVQVNELWSVYCEGVPEVFTTKIFRQEGVDISDIRVYDEAGTAYVRLFGAKDKNMVKDVFTQETSEDGNSYTLNIYHQTTDDTFNIHVSYVLSGAVTNYADAAMFEYEIIDYRLFSEMMPEVLVSMVTHKNLEKFTDFKLSVYTNSEYELTPVNKAQTDFSLKDVNTNQDVAVKLILPLDVFPNNTLTSEEYITGTGDYEKPVFYVITPSVWEIFTPSILFKIDLLTTVRSFPGGWAGIIMVILSPVIIIGGITLFGRRNSEKARIKQPYAPDFKKRYLFYYPDDMNYAEAARLMFLAKKDHMDSPKYFASILLSLYGKGYINILSTKRSIRIKLTGKIDEYHLRKYEQLFLIFLEEALGEKGEGSMKEISEYMFRNCDKVSSLTSSINAILDENLTAMGHIAFVSDNVIYDKVTSRLSRPHLVIYTAVMVVFAGICNFMFIMGMGRGFLALGLLVLSVITVLAASMTPQKIITQKGEDAAAKWDAYCRFLNESERLMSEKHMFDSVGYSTIFIYAAAFDVNKRAMRYLNDLLPWVGEDHNADSPEERRYAIPISRLLQFMDELEKMKENCLKLYDSEKGPFYRQRSQKRINDFLSGNAVTAVEAAAADVAELISEDEVEIISPESDEVRSEDENTDKAV